MHGTQLYQVRYWWTDQPHPNEGGLYGAEHYETQDEADKARDAMAERQREMALVDASSTGKLCIEVRCFELKSVTSVGLF